MNTLRIGAVVVLLVWSLGCGPDTNVKWRTLYTAVQKGDVEDVKKHLLRGAKINERNATYGWTPLHKAVAMNHQEMVRVLLENGARPDLKDRWGKTPLDLAEELGHTEIADLIRKHRGSNSRAPSD